MIKATRKWLAIKISSGLLIPFMIWFIVSLVAFTFYTLTISEVFEDYINNSKLKNAANRTLVLFSIVFTLVVIIFLINI